MTSWCPNCDDQQTDVPWSYYNCVKCGAVVGLSTREHPMEAKAYIKLYTDQGHLREICQNTLPNMDMLS